MNQKLKAVLTVLIAVSLMTTPAIAASSTGAAAGGPLAFGVDLGAPNAPGDVVEYGDTNPRPGVFVSVGSSDDMDSLEQWANASADRSVLEHYDSTNTALIAAPVTDLKSPLDPREWVSSEKTISDLGYVTGWTWDRQTQMVDPVNTLDTSDAFEKPRGSWWAETTTSGDYGPDAMAWSSDAPAVNMTDTRSLVGADEVSATGEGVDVAVIDSGTNFGNGTLYGDGTSGSDMRVTDAYDFVEGEGADLSVSRENLTDELETVEDPNGHGSWVSSAVLNAQTGIAPDANLMVYRALNSEGSGSTSDIRSSISRADAKGADIAVMSLGSPMWSEGMAAELKHALSEDGNMTGAFVAVGNSYKTTRYVSSPSDVESVIGVTATNGVNASAAQKASFANTGPDTGLDGSGGDTHGIRPDTAAPGMNISTPTYSVYGSNPSDTTLSGTSMAAPVSAGVGALLLDAEPSLKGEPDAFHDRMVDSGAHTPNIGTTESVGGMSNATRAINGYDGPDAPDRNLTDSTEARDAANRALAGDVGVKMAEITDVMNGAWSVSESVGLA